MQVKDVMTTDLGYCIPEEATTKAAYLMKQLDIGIVPIVASESNKQLLGVVTDRDLCMAVIAEGLDPRTVKLEQCMSTAVVATLPEDDIDLAINLMRDHQIRRVPVVNTAGKLEGMVSTADVFQRAEVPAKKTHEALSSVSEPSYT
jgi:CBS domain-containing protein